MRSFAILSLVASMLGSVSASPTLVNRAVSFNRTIAPAGAIVVDETGEVAGSYTTFQAGVDALSANTIDDQYLFVAPGTYFEQVYLPALASNLTIQGYTPDARTYRDNQATLTYNLALINTTSDDLTATFRAHNTNTKVYNLIIKNTFGHINSNGQNLALSSYATNVGFYATQFWGYQDTVLAEAGYQLYAKCLIVGAIDFIFGEKALAWFEKNDIRTIANGAITASGRTNAEVDSWYVINNSNIANLNSSLKSYNNYLGRPWRDYARVVFQNSYLGDNIVAAGWQEWSTSAPQTDEVFFGEYNNYGPGSVLQEGPRANFSSQLTASIDITTVLGTSHTNEFYYDASYM
ncbi:pectin methyl esterase [Sclerotinia borealis F-4128]|uniref:Pectinesterase n=1 Tax=Sclerotinia borealis (strain F-4128) TaxID=1432307 RepID=W9CRJ0_SCLBF|nr:pectin methyl esterase [Sclerotinia borealis F-4128]